ncbi:MAG: glycosyltransferase family 87 protein [Planctomycetota bacterium]|nr:glycosyltransferase family 87 protein [Planctomycetota bacterium]
MDPTLSLLAAVAWLLAAVALWRSSGRNQLALLGLACVVAAASYFGLGRFHGEGRFVHDHELYHHTLGSHYMPELGHYGLYGATCLALVENGREPGELPDLVTDLRTYQLESGAASLARGGAFRARFSDARWAEFRRDVAFFDGRVGGPGWEKILVDHGHNASPFWSAIGSRLVGWFGLSSTSLVAFGLLDLLLLVAMLLALWRAFDARAALLFATFYFANVFAPFDITGGAFLRHLWLAAVVGAVCCMQGGRLRLAAVFLAIATLDRFFPAVLIVWPAIEALRAARRGGEARRLFGPHAQAVVVFGATVVLGVLLTGPGAWAAFFRNVYDHGQGFYINQISLRSLFTINPATATDVFADESLWMRERVGLDAAWHFSLRGARLACMLLLGLALWRERSLVRGLVLLSFAPFVLLYPADYYHVFLALGLVVPGRARKLVVVGMALLFALAHLLHAGGASAGTALAALSQVELFNWWVSLAILGAFLALLQGVLRDRRAWLAAGACVALGFGVDLVRSQESSSLDLIPSDVTTKPGIEVLREGMHRWGNGWQRGDQVVVKASGVGDRATVVLAVADAGPYRLRVDLTTTPVFAKVQVSLADPGSTVATPIGEPIELYSPQVGLVSALLPECQLSAGEHHLRFTVVGKHPASSYAYFGIDQLAWEPVRPRDRATALAEARAWLATNPGDLPPEPAFLSAEELAAKYRGQQPALILKGLVDPRHGPLVRDHLADLARSQAMPVAEDAPEAPDSGLVEDGLRWALGLCDTNLVARLLPLARAVGLGSEHPRMVAAQAFLLDQQRLDGSFGPAEPTSYRPRARTVELALLALAEG